MIICGSLEILVSPGTGFGDIYLLEKSSTFGHVLTASVVGIPYIHHISPYITTQKEKEGTFLNEINQ